MPRALSNPVFCLDGKREYGVCTFILQAIQEWLRERFNTTEGVKSP